MRRLLRSIALFIGIVAVLLALPLLFKPEGGQVQEVPASGMPWQIEVLPDGATRVFGLVPGRSTLDEARRQLGPDPQLALVAAPGENGSLEVYYESVATGPLTGRMVLTLETTPAEREQMIQRARKIEYMKSTTRRVELGDEDLVQTGRRVVTAIAFIPAANLDEQIVLQRFGTPAERIRNSENTEHFLYPDKGLDLQLDTKGKELLQYVAPGSFAQLREPLLAKPQAEVAR